MFGCNRSYYLWRHNSHEPHAATLYRLMDLLSFFDMVVYDLRKKEISLVNYGVASIAEQETK